MDDMTKHLKMMAKWSTDALWGMRDHLVNALETDPGYFEPAIRLNLAHCNAELARRTKLYYLPADTVRWPNYVYSMGNPPHTVWTMEEVDYLVTEGVPTWWVRAAHA